MTDEQRRIDELSAENYRLRREVDELREQLLNLRHPPKTPEQIAATRRAAGGK